MRRCGNTSKIEAVTVSRYFFTNMLAAQKFHHVQQSKM